MAHSSMDDELSLRDIADILARSRAIVVTVPLVCGLLAYGAVALGPKSFTSSTIVSVGNALADAQTQSRAGAFNARLLPKPAALSEAYVVAAPARLTTTWSVSDEVVARDFDAEYDQEDGAIVLRASADSPDLAQRRARLVAQDFERYVDSLVVSSIRGQFSSRLQERRLDLRADEAVLINLREALGRTPGDLTGRGLPSARDALQSSGVDRRFAGDSDSPVNPAYTLLAVRIAEVEARLAENRAQVTQLAETLENRSRLLSLAREVLQLNVLANANKPSAPNGLGAALAAALGVLVGALLALLLAFALHALRVPSRRAVTVPQHAD